MKEYHPLVSHAMARLEKLGKSADSTYLDRLEIESLEIEKQGLWGYFSGIVDRDEKYSNDNHLLTAYLWGICRENPIGTGEELSWVDSNDFPDIDTDFLPGDRDKVKDWIAKRFGEDRVCSICNYSTYQTKSALLDVSRVFEVPLSEVRELTTKLDNEVNKLDWKVALRSYPKLKIFQEKYPEVCAIVERLRGRHYRLGKHAAGVIIADRPLTDIVPLVQRDGKVMSAWAEGQATSDLKTVGLVKFDILGLDNLDYIKTSRELISDVWRRLTFEEGDVLLERFQRINGKTVGELKPGDDVKVGKSTGELLSIEPVKVDFESNDDYLEDEESLSLAKEGRLIGVFQFDSPGIRELVKRINITSFEDIVSATCLYRPGPLDSGMAEDFVRRRNKEETYELHKILEPIVGRTEGIALYQEQTMQIFSAVGGISLPNCEKIRKAMGQKRVSEFLKFKDEFIETGSKRLGWLKTRREAEKKKSDPEATVEAFWDKIEKSSGYLFNRSHGVVYSVVSMQCLYLKTHFPREYFAAVLTHLDPGDERRAIYIREAERLGVEFVPVHINKSRMGFTIEDDGKVYFGFDKIKGIGAQSEKILKGQPYHSFDDFISRFGVGKRVCEPLVKLGAFDDFESNRKALFEAYTYHYQQKGRKNQRKILFDSGEKRQQYLEFIRREESGEKIKMAERYAQPIVIDPNGEKFTAAEISSFEDQYYGLFFNHPLTARRVQGLTIEKIKENRAIEVYVADIKQKKTKKGNPYYILSTEDETGTLSVIIWENEYNALSALLEPGNCLYMEVDPPERFPTAKLKRGGKVRKLRTLDEPSEAEEQEVRLEQEFEDVRSTLQSIRAAMEFSNGDES